MVINKKGFIKGLIIFNVILMLFFGNIVYIFHVPTFFKYVPDVFNCIILFYTIFHINKILNNKYLKPLIFIIFLLLVHVLIDYIINDYSLLFLIWGLRNVMKSIVIFLGTAICFDNRDINKFYKTIDVVYLINFIECIFQYFLLNWKGDYLGGTFSYGLQGGNGPLTVLLIIELIIVLNQFLTKKATLKKMIYVFFTYIIVSALGELKFAFLLFALCIVISLIINKKSLKMIFISIGGFAIVLLGITLLNKYFPATNNFFTFQNIMEYTSSENHGYATENDLSRTRAFKQINERFLTSKTKKLFGYGLGNCSAIPPLKKTSNFYYLYADTLHYTWLTHSYIYIEMGLIGFIYIVILFFLLPIQYRKIFKNDNNFQTYFLISIIAILMIWYNEFLVYEYSYFLYFLLALPFSIEDSKTEIKKEI